MNEWLKGYDYKINIGFGVFVMVIGLSIIITLITVSFQAIRAATANPTRSLRSE
jgi:putative ABC transport system permease protein